MIFDWEVTLGNVLSIGSFAVACTVFVLMMRADIMVLAQRVHSMEETLKTLAETTARIAEQSRSVEMLTERVNTMGRRVDHFINNRNRA